MNLVLVGIFGFLILQDVTDFYPEPIGSFVWFGFDKFLNRLINGTIFCLGIISIGIQFNLDRIYVKNTKGILLKILNLIYGIFIKIFGIISLILSLYDNLSNNFVFNSFGYLVFSLVIYCLNIYLIYLGFLVIQQTFDKDYAKENKLTYENDILDQFE